MSDAHPKRGFLFTRLFEPLLDLLKQGMSPSRLALCVSVGIVVGNIPILGVSSILCAVIALVCRLNLPAIQLVQAAMAPTQILLIIPFVRLGEWLLQAPHQALSIRQGFALIHQSIANAVRVLWDAIIHAGSAWLLVAPVAIFLLHKLFTIIFRRAATRLEPRDGPDAARAQPTPLR
jgi:uncharacterized protein (DUF2062 family)